MKFDLDTIEAKVVASDMPVASKYRLTDVELSQLKTVLTDQPVKGCDEILRRFDSPVVRNVRRSGSDMPRCA